MEIGIIGLPNVGKTTLFNALTESSSAAENFPFTTIEPNVGIVPIPDSRLGVLQEKTGSQKSVPAGIRFVDIAGLVKGASKGEGLGNKFLSHIRTVDALVHVIRCFTDDNVADVMGGLDPIGSVDIIETELLLADIQQIEKSEEKILKIAKSGDKKAKETNALFETAKEALNSGKPIRTLSLPQEFINEFQFLTSKPVLYLANTDEGQADQSMIDALKQRAQKENSQVVVMCAKIEAEIIQLPPEERKDYYESAGIKQPGLETLVQASKDLLNLVCFFTSNKNETHAWLVNKGTKAPKAAGKIHTDMQQGFIRAEVYKYGDLARLGTTQTLHAKGLIATEGKEYEIQEGDVVLFNFKV